MQGQAIVSETFLTFEIWFTVAGIYLAVTLTLSFLARVWNESCGCNEGIIEDMKPMYENAGGEPSQARNRSYGSMASASAFPNGVVALSDFSIDIYRTEVVVVIGPSGSGKSTFLRCLNGLEEIDAGSIVIDGIPLDRRKKNRFEIRKEEGMVFQSFNLFPH